MLAFSLFGVFLAVYPNGRFVPRWTRYIVLPGLVAGLLYALYPQAYASPDPLNAIFALLVATILFVATLYAQVWRYRFYSTPTQRQQTKWFLYALAIFTPAAIGMVLFLSGILPSGLLTAAESVAIELTLGTMGTLAFGFLPIAIGFAILRYRLWDIDILIRRTLIYGLVTATLILTYFILVFVLQRIFSALSGTEQDEFVTVVSTLAIAAMFVPVRNRIQTIIDLHFYRKKYDAQQVLEQFSQTLRNETDLEKLSAGLVQVVQETMQPESVGVWLVAKNKDKRPRDAI
jgi:hypothetical protein